MGGVTAGGAALVAAQYRRGWNPRPTSPIPARLESAPYRAAPYRTMMVRPAALELESARRPFFTVSLKFAE